MLHKTSNPTAGGGGGGHFEGGCYWQWNRRLKGIHSPRNLNKIRQETNPNIGALDKSRKQTSKQETVLFEPLAIQPQVKTRHLNLECSVRHSCIEEHILIHYDTGWYRDSRKSPSRTLFWFTQRTRIQLERKKDSGRFYNTSNVWALGGNLFARERSDVWVFSFNRRSYLDFSTRFRNLRRFCHRHRFWASQSLDGMPSNVAMMSNFQTLRGHLSAASANHSNEFGNQVNDHMLKYNKHLF